METYDLMTATERLENLLKGEPVDRPPFIPAIYDLKPTFLKADPHLFGQKEEEITAALIFEAEQLDADALTAGYDIYNVEAEAAGCAVLRDPDIHMPEIASPLLNTIDEFDRLKKPDGLSGRMEVYIKAAGSILQKYERAIPVRGGISGPFTMATRILSQEKILMEVVTDPDKLIGLLGFCTDIIKTYAGAFADIGAGVIVFDSFAGPPMLSPQNYHDLVLPFHRDIFDALRKRGVLQRTLIIGGNTLTILEDIISSGATQFLLDFTIPLEESRTVLQQYPDTVFRVNLPPTPFIHRNTNELQDIIGKTLNCLKDHQNLIIGTGILPKQALPSNIISAKKQIINFFK